MSRPDTPPVATVTDDGTRRTRHTVKRSCNGCGAQVGDVTDEEMEAGIAGLPLPDVRDECPTCGPVYLLAHALVVS